MKKYLSFALAIVLLSCSKDDIKTEILTAKISVLTLSDSTCLGEVNSIKRYKNSIFLSDSKNNRIIVLDSNLTLKHYIGNGTGDGPAEFLSSSKFTFLNDTLYVFGSPNGISKFSINGAFIGYLHVQDMSNPNNLEICQDSIGQIFYSTMNEKPITKINLEGNKITSFGCAKTYNKKVNLFKSCTHLLKNKNILLSINLFDFSVDLFDFNGNFLKTIDYSALPFLKSTINGADVLAQKHNGNRPYMVENVCVYQNHLFIQYCDHYENNNNGIIEFSIVKDQLIFEKVYKLDPLVKSNNFGPFLVFNKKIIIFEKDTGALKLYEYR